MEIREGKVVGRDGLLALDLIEVGQCIDIELVLIEDGGGIVENGVPVGALLHLQQRHIDLQKGFFGLYVLLTPSAVGLVHLLLQNVSPLQVKLHDAFLLDAQLLLRRTDHFLQQCPSSIIDAVGFGLIDLKFPDTRSQGNQTVSIVQLLFLQLQAGVLVDEFEGPLETFLSPLVLDFLIKAAPQVVVELVAVGLASKSGLILIQCFGNFTHRFVVIPQKRVDFGLFLLGT